MSNPLLRDLPPGFRAESLILPRHPSWVDALAARWGRRTLPSPVEPAAVQFGGYERSAFQPAVPR